MSQIKTINNEQKEFLINNDRCIKVVKNMHECFKDQDDLANVEFPSNIKYRSNEYYLYMFYSCLLDYGMRSKIYHRRLNDTYKIFPNVFEPSSVLKISECELKNIIVSYIHPRYPNVAVKKWIGLSKKLNEHGNILNCLKRVGSFEELKNFIDSLKEYGQKTGGLLIRIICDSNICDFKESIKSIPIDRHDIEISYLTGVINKKKISDKNIKTLSDTYVKIGKEMRIDPSDVDKYLWELGNSFCNKKKCGECPLNDCCQKKYNED